VSIKVGLPAVTCVCSS